MNLCVFLLCFGAMLPNKEEKKEPVDYVNPFIGTKSMGHTFRELAFRMVQCS